LNGTHAAEAPEEAADRAAEATEATPDEAAEAAEATPEEAAEAAEAAPEVAEATTPPAAPVALELRYVRFARQRQSQSYSRSTGGSGRAAGVQAGGGATGLYKGSCQHNERTSSHCKVKRTDGDLGVVVGVTLGVGDSESDRGSDWEVDVPGEGVSGLRSEVFDGSSRWLTTWDGSKEVRG
jgi:hypothetical protein